MTGNKHIILYAEDDPDDLFIVQQAFEAHKENIEVLHAGDGLKALHHLNKLEEEGQLPCLIILDMNMPGMNGRDALVKIKQHPTFKSIPAVMFTTSNSIMDKEFAKKWGADFITKPVIYADLEDLAKTFVDRCDSEISKRA